MVVRGNRLHHNLTTQAFRAALVRELSHKRGESVPQSDLAATNLLFDQHPQSRLVARPLRLLYVGDAWKGSSARSMREALEFLQATAVSEVDPGHYFPSYRSIVLRGVNRLLRFLQGKELEHRIVQLLHMMSPDVFLAYKGSGISTGLVRRMKAEGVLTVNIFPDCSPHAHGRALSQAIGEYDLVISTKPFHPEGWRHVYGYRNTCVCVPHGYDPTVHYWATAPTGQVFDVVLAATWRPEYHKLMLDFATEMREWSCQVGLAGNGWRARRGEFPPHWSFADTPTGREYGTFLRSGRIAIAPVQRDVVVSGKRQPGDEDTTRTYELAAAQCFFVHRRTDYVQTVFKERTEVPLWDDVTELAALVRHYLPRNDERRMMATAAHKRAVPEYSVPNRAAQVMDHIRAQLAARIHLSAQRGGAPKE
jgi:glycosyl transferase family 1